MVFRKSTGSASKRAADIFTAATGHAKEKIKQPNIILKLFRGDIKLMITFWTFCISLPLVGDMIFSHLVFPHLEVESPLGTAAMFVWGTFMAVYGVIASVGLWRSASRYAGSRIWASLAKAGAVLGVAGAIAYAVRWYGAWMLLASV